MIATNNNEKHRAVKSPQTLMNEVDFKQTPQTEIDQMRTLVGRYQNLDPIRDVKLGNKIIKYCTPNLMTLGRVWNLFDAEPVTIEWILNFNENEILFDIGANVGTYGIFASVMKNAIVYAFEPESQNFSLLTKNIIYNDLSERMTAWPVAISDEQKFSLLNLWGFRAGNSHHFFDESKNFKLEEENFPFVQGAVSTTIDARYFRPTETDLLLGDPTKAHRILKWRHTTSFVQLIQEMVKYDIDLLKTKINGQ